MKCCKGSSIMRSVGLLLEITLFVFVVQFHSSCAVTTGKFNRTSRLYENVVIAVPRTFNHIADVHNVKFVFALQKFFTQTASQMLCNATGGRAAFGNITLLLSPDSSEQPTSQWSSWQRLSNADFRVGYGGPRPRVVQSRGCGQSGDYIHISPQFVYNLTYPENEKQFIALWFQHRYGVFPEAAEGFAFNVNTQKFEPNSCTNKPLKFHLIHNELFFENATCEMDPKTGEVSSSCILQVDGQENAEVTSSLLYDQTLPTIHEFCNSATHNRYMATPQNLLCHGKSVWDVVKEHADFNATSEPGAPLLNCGNLSDVSLNTVYRNCRSLHIFAVLNKSSEDEEIIFRALKEAMFTYVSALAEETLNVTFYKDSEQFYNTTITIETNKTETWENVNRILDRVYGKKEEVITMSSSDSVPSEKATAEVSESSAFEASTTDFEITTAGTTAAETTSPTQQTALPTQQTASRVGQKRNSRNAGDKPCDGCVIKNILEEIKKLPQCDNTLLLITDSKGVLPQITSNTSSGDQHSAESDLAKEFQASGIRVLTIGVNHTVDDELESLAEATIGRSYSVLSNDSSRLLDPLFDYSNVEGDQFVMVNDSVIEANATTGNFEFRIQPEAGIKSIHFQMRGSSEFKLKEDPLLQTCVRPSGLLNVTYCQLEEVILKDGKDLIVSGTMGEPGKVRVLVIGEIDASPPVIVSSWLSNNNKKVNLTTDPLFIYSELSQDGFPVTRATVEASITSPDGSSQDIKLRDDGAGPDITAHDGVYSGYFNLCKEKGRYSFRIKAMNNQETQVGTVCSDATKQLCWNESRPFVRLSSAGSAVLEDCGDAANLLSFPVRDLSVKHVEQVPNTAANPPVFELTWTDTIGENKDVKLFIGNYTSWPLDGAPGDFPEAEVNRPESCSNGRCSYKITLQSEDPDPLFYLVLIANSSTASFCSNVPAVRPYATNTSSPRTTPSPTTVSGSSTIEVNTGSSTTEVNTSSSVPSNATASPSKTDKDDKESAAESSPVALIVTLVLVAVVFVAGAGFYFLYYRPRRSRMRGALADHSVSYSSLE